MGAMSLRLTPAHETLTASPARTALVLTEIVLLLAPTDVFSATAIIKLPRMMRVEPISWTASVPRRFHRSSGCDLVAPSAYCTHRARLRALAQHNPKMRQLIAIIASVLASSAHALVAGTIRVPTHARMPAVQLRGDPPTTASTLEDLFEWLDVDGNGWITRDEVVELAALQTEAKISSYSEVERMVGKFLMTADDAALDKVFEIADLNDDGGVTFSEFVSAASELEAGDNTMA